METSINQRIKLIVERSGKTITSYSAAIGVSQPALRAVVDGGNSPRFDTLQKLLIANPMISAEWLMLGTGNMKKEPTQHVGDINNSTAVVNHGDGNVIANNRTSPTEELLQLQREYLDMLKKKDEQIDRLTGVIEKLMGKL